MPPVSSKKCILICIPVLLKGGGTEIHTLAIVKAMLTAGYSVTICCYYEYDEEMVRRFEEVGAKVLLMKYERIDGLWHLAKGLILVFKEKKPDIVHIQYLAPGLVPIVAARLAGVRTVFATVHIAGSYAYGLKAKMLLRIAARLCTSFICVSRGVEEFWFGNSEIFDPANVNKYRRHFTVYNAIDTSDIANTVNAVDRSKMKEMLGIAGRPVIGIVGRLAQQKGHTILLDAIAEVIKKFPGIVLIIIGEGPERQKLITKASEININNNILWVGVQPQNRVFEFYAIMNIFVMPSIYEGFGLTAAEAMAAGVPVVASDVDGLREVVVDRVTGYMVPVNDDRTLAERLIQLLNNPEQAQAMGRNGRDRVSRLFSIERFDDSIRAVYNHFSKIM